MKILDSKLAPDPQLGKMLDLDPHSINAVPHWFNSIYRKGRPSYRRSLQPSKENIQHFKTWKFFTFFCFCGSFLPSWIRIRIQELKLMRIRIRIRISNPGIHNSVVFREKRECRVTRRRPQAGCQRLSGPAPPGPWETRTSSNSPDQQLKETRHQIWKGNCVEVLTH